MTSHMLWRITRYYKVHVVILISVISACSSALVLWGFIHLLFCSVNLLSYGNTILIILLICRSVCNLR